MMGLSLWNENSTKLVLFCGHGHHRAECLDASMMGLSLWKLLLFWGHGHHGAGCWDASMMGLSFWSEKSAKSALFCGHRHPKVGCGDASIVVPPLWSDNLASTTLFREQYGHELYCRLAFGSHLTNALLISSERPKLRSYLGYFLLGFSLGSNCKLFCINLFLYSDKYFTA